MECAVHPGANASETCKVCGGPRCAACLVCEIDAQPACRECEARETEKNRSLGGTILALVSVGYLATLAVGYTLFKARPFVGGIAAIFAIALGRTLQVHLRPSVIRPRRVS